MFKSALFVVLILLAGGLSWLNLSPMVWPVVSGPSPTPIAVTTPAPTPAPFSWNIPNIDSVYPWKEKVLAASQSADYRIFWNNDRRGDGEATPAGKLYTFDQKLNATTSAEVQQFLASQEKELTNNGWAKNLELDKTNYAAMMADGPTGISTGFLKSDGERLRTIVLGSNLVGKKIRSEVFISEPIELSELFSR